jgi:hypothetical protein
MSPLRLLASASAAGVLLATAAPSFGQASSSELAGFPMPPPSGYWATKHFSYVGDYGYFTAPTSAVPGTTAHAADYKYVRYSGIGGKRVFVYGAWGTTPVPNPSGTADACGHAHTSYGVWTRWEFRVLFFRRISGWIPLGGGGMSGIRNAQGQCVFRTDTPLASIDPRYGWGLPSLGFDFRGTSFFRDLVVGALSNTHGWGSCTVPTGTFKACHEPSYIIGYTLP